MRKQAVGAAEFKARCLALIDQVAETGNAIVITKRGKPVARLAPVASKRRSVVGALKGHIRVTGDIVAPVVTDDVSVRLIRRVPGPTLVRVGKRLVARPTVAAAKLPRLDLADLVRQERDRWPW